MSQLNTIKEVCKEFNIPEDFINPEVRNTMRSCGGFDRNLLRLKLPNIIIRGVKHRIMSITKTNEYIVLGGKRVYLYRSAVCNIGNQKFNYSIRKANFSRIRNYTRSEKRQRA